MAARQDLKDLRTGAIGRQLAPGTALAAWDRRIPHVVPGSPGPYRDGNDVVYFAAGPVSVLACQSGEIGRVGAGSIELVVDSAEAQVAATLPAPAVGALLALDKGAGAKLHWFVYRSARMKPMVQPGGRVQIGQPIAVLDAQPGSAPVSIRKAPGNPAFRLNG